MASIIAEGMVPLVIDFGTGKPLEGVPQGWSSEAGGRKAAAFAASLKFKTSSKNQAEFRPWWAAFRLWGTVKLEFEAPSVKSASQFVDFLRSFSESNPPVCEGCPWNKKGDPVEGGMKGNVPIRAILKGIARCSLMPARGGLDWQMHWLEIAQQMNEPGGQWASPFVLPVIPLAEIILLEDVVTVSIRLYASRLLFYLIADEALADLMRPLTPVGSVEETYSNADDDFEEIFTRGSTSASPFSVAGIMRAAENSGYVAAEQPPEIALVMKPYQLQTLKWMMDQEALPRGLNGCFWEERSWAPAPTEQPRKAARLSGFSPPESKFYVSLSLGEFRLEKPPLVRGGLLCEEMGLGKSLEIVALIVASRQRMGVEPPVTPKQIGIPSTKATLIVAPDTLIAQWVQEIRKSCRPDDALEVCTFVLDSTTDYKQEKEVGGPLSNKQKRSQAETNLVISRFLNCDICLTSFRTVEEDKILQKIMWQRVVIDEMQMIRSSTTKVAKMCENLSAHARWMVSGTPLYASVKDLNGELNFLEVIPFSLTDSKDGFWNQRLGKPLADQDPDALDLLHFMLSRLMMRHSKAQLYKTGPLTGSSILQLPEMRKELVGLTFDSYEEEATYRHMEAIGLRAARTQLTMLEQQPRQDRPAVIALESLRILAVSPNLLVGGNGVTGDLARVARLWRSLVPTVWHENAGHHTHSALTNDYFSNPVAMPGDRIRDLFLARTGNNGGNKGLSQNDVAIRLEQAQNEVSQKKATLTFAKAGSFDGLPKRRWNWVIRCVTSGRYILMQVCRRKSIRGSLTGSGEVARLFRNCPLLFGRACKSLVSLRKYTLARNVLDQTYVHYFNLKAKDLMDELRIRHDKPVIRTVEISEGVYEDQEQLWFYIDGHVEIPSRPPTASELFQESIATSPTRPKKRQIINESEDEASSDEADLMSSEDEEEEALPSPESEGGKKKRLQIRTSLRIKRDNVDDNGIKWDFFAHEAFWRKAFCKALMSRHSALKKDMELKKQFWETTSHPGFESPSVDQLLRWSQLDDKLGFEAVYWYASSSDETDTKRRAWFSVEKPRPLRGGRVAVTFRDGQTRVVDSHELRLVESAFQGPAPDDLTLKEALQQLRLTSFVPKFSDLIGKEHDLDLALSLSEDELAKRLISDSDAAYLLKEKNAHSKKGPKESKKSEIRDVVASRIEKFRQSSILRDVKRVRTELFSRRHEVRKALSQAATASDTLIPIDAGLTILQGFCINPYPSAAWESIWKLAEGNREGETIDWCTVAFGLKGETSHPDLQSKELIPKKIRDIAEGQEVSVRLQASDATPSMYVGWFLAYVVSLPDSNSLDAPRWRVELKGNAGLGVLDIASESIKSLGADSLGKRKKKRFRLADEDEASEGERERQLAAAAEQNKDEKDAHLMNKDLAGYSRYLNGTIRLRFAGESAVPIKSAKERIKQILTDILDARATLPDLERFETILIRASERGGAAGAQLAVNQGFQALEQLIENDVNFERPKCTICLDSLSEEPIILGCLHLFCKECLVMQKKAHDASMYAFHKALSCPLCRREINPAEMFLVLPPEVAQEPAPSTVASTTTTTTTTPFVSDVPESDRKRPPEWTAAVDDAVVKDKFSRLPDGVSSWDAFSQRFVGLPRNFMTLLRIAAGVDQIPSASRDASSRLSTKLNQVVQDVMAVEGKVVIFSQFSKSVALLMNVLSRAGVAAVKIARGDPVSELSRAVETFNTSPDCKVLVLHSGSGAAGLTLTVARHVFLLEPFLKAGEEAQALNRVHRIGQTHNVQSRCYFMRGTVEERILAWRNVITSNTNAPVAARRALDVGDEDKEDGLVVLAEDDQAKSIASLSNAFLAYVLGESYNVV